MNKILHGSALEQLKTLEENSTDAIVTDPPYGLSFMGKKWDYDVPSVNVWQECLRVMKPGGFLLSFAGTRTYHRLVCGIEDAGFEIRDMISWLYGSGFPKSLNIGKQIDKVQGNEREIIGTKGLNKYNSKGMVHTVNYRSQDFDKANELTKGNSEWEGWGTALKPACEPIVVARKPLSEKNVALNVLKWGTGGINIDECRIGSETHKVNVNDFSNIHSNKYGSGAEIKTKGYREQVGRFPANIILDEEAGKMLDEQSGICKTGNINKNLVGFKKGCLYGDSKMVIRNYKTDKPTGASRFFYCAKASKSERGEENKHPTVKPIKLMEYLIKLVSKEQALILDPFLGSGTTAIACVKLNRKFIGIEKEEEYVEIANRRLANVTVKSA
jgi:site-specific DNA-methyltransferase (adenine-specific)